MTQATLSAASRAPCAGKTMEIGLREPVFFALMVGRAVTLIVAGAARLGATTFELGVVVPRPSWLGRERA